MIDKIQLHWNKLEVITDLKNKTTIIGKNGSGKSTLLNVITAIYAGKPISNIPKNMYLKVHFTGINTKNLRNAKAGIFERINNTYTFNNNGRFKHLYDFAHIGKLFNVIKFTNTGDARSGIFNLNDYSRSIEKEFNNYLLNKLSSEGTITKYTGDINSTLKPFGIELSSIAPISANGFIPVSALSSGEQFIVLLSVASSIAKDSVLLIDEPENSLHIKWQSLIQAMLKDNNCKQTIICTHSPFIANNAENLWDIEEQLPVDTPEEDIEYTISVILKHIGAFKKKHKQIEEFFKQLNNEIKP